MKLSPKAQVVLVGLLLLLLQAAIDATREYMKVDVTPTFAEWGRAVAVAIIGAVLYWLRSPKDKVE